MAYDLDEQEQLANLKVWWGRYKKLTFIVVLIALVVSAGWSGWRAYQRNQSVYAVQLYEELQKAITAKDNAKIQRISRDIQSQYARSVYAQISALFAAKNAVDNNDLKTAQAQLEWAAFKGVNETYAALARIRLAQVLLDQKDYQKGLDALHDLPVAFASVAADRKGDLLAAQGKNKEAQAAYQIALFGQSQEKNPAYRFMQLKYDAVSAQIK